MTRRNIVRLNGRKIYLRVEQRPYVNVYEVFADEAFIHVKDVCERQCNLAAVLSRVSDFAMAHYIAIMLPNHCYLMAQRLYY